MLDWFKKLWARLLSGNDSSGREESAAEATVADSEETAPQKAVETVISVAGAPAIPTLSVEDQVVGWKDEKPTSVAEDWYPRTHWVPLEETALAEVFITADQKTPSISNFLRHFWNERVRSAFEDQKDSREQAQKTIDAAEAKFAESMTAVRTAAGSHLEELYIRRSQVVNALETSEDELRSLESDFSSISGEAQITLPELLDTAATPVRRSSYDERFRPADLPDESLVGDNSGGVAEAGVVKPGSEQPIPMWRIDKRFRQWIDRKHHRETKEKEQTNADIADHLNQLATLNTIQQLLEDARDRTRFIGVEFTTAGKLSIPYYEQPEISFETLTKGQRERYQHLLHRRRRSPIIPEYFSQILTLAMGFILGSSYLAIFASGQARPFGLDKSVFTTVCMALGYAVAIASRAAVTILFLQLGEEAGYRWLNKQKSSHKLLVLKWVGSLLVLAIILLLDYALGSAGVYQSLLTQDAGNALDSAATATAANSARTPHTNSNLQQIFQLLAPLTFMFAYMIYSSAEGFLRGRDVVLELAIYEDIHQQQKEAIQDLHVGRELMQSVAKSYNALIAMRAFRTRLRKELMEINLQITNATGQLSVYSPAAKMSITDSKRIALCELHLTRTLQQFDMLLSRLLLDDRYSRSIMAGEKRIAMWKQLVNQLEQKSKTHAIEKLSPNETEVQRHELISRKQSIDNDRRVKVQETDLLVASVRTDIDRLKRSFKGDGSVEDAQRKLDIAHLEAEIMRLKLSQSGPNTKPPSLLARLFGRLRRK